MSPIASPIVRVFTIALSVLSRVMRHINRFGFSILSIVFVGALTAALIWAGLKYEDQLAASRKWISVATANDTTLSLLDAFELARDAGIIKVELGAQRVPRIDVADCGDRLRPTAAGDARDTALKILCDTPQGNQIIAEIDQWNASFELLALRDDFDRPSGDEVKCDKGEIAKLYMHFGCRDSVRHWTARIALNNKDTGLKATTERGSAPFKDFAMLAEEHERWMNDWLVANPVGELDPGAQVEFTAKLPGATKRAVVHVIGNLSAIAIDGAAPRPVEVDGTPRKVSQQMTFGRVTTTVKVVCKYTRTLFRGRNRGSRVVRSAECKPGSADTPRGYIVTIASDGTATPAVKLYASPRRARFSGSLLDGGDPERKRWILQRSTNIAISCTAQIQDCNAADFALEWLPSVRGKVIEVDYDIFDRNGTSLIDDDGQISADALSSGLAPVIGLGPGDPGSLVWSLERALARRQTTQNEVQLSIDLQVQATVNGILRRRMTDLQSGKVGGATKRAAFVLMDAGDAPAERGQIIAAASVPSVESGYNIWDIRALMESNAASSPVLGHAWSSPDGATTPGSTFKAVTSLALIERVLSNPSDSFLPFMLGAQARDVRRKLDIRSDPDDPVRDALLIPIGNGDSACPNPRRCYAIRNAEGEAKLETAYLTRTASKCPSAGTGAAQLGMCEALISSSNLYFGGVARYLDEPKVLDANRSSELFQAIPKLEVAAMARRFMCGDRPLSLLASAPAVAKLAYRLRSPPLDVLASKQGVNKRQSVAFSGFGQAVSATPLAMAAVYGSIAARRIVKPRITLAADSESGTCAGDGELIRGGGEPARGQYLDLLKAGLSGVVFSPEGTAYKHMPHRDKFTGRLFAKTGTAQVAGVDYTTWLVGWIDPPNSPLKAPAVAPRRLAFACMVTDSKGSGGSTCGPIVDEVLATLEGMPTTIRKPPVKRVKVVKRQ
jgi:cell division protein FtsI/penicillin-binding protein 2